MGQYFRVVNLDKREWFETPLVKLWEICANNEIGVLAYLLATNNPDGTPLAKEAIKTRNGKLKPPKWAKHFGRWCGDRIVVIGDYAEGATNYKIEPGVYPSYSELNGPTWRNITKELFEEYERFMSL